MWEIFSEFLLFCNLFHEPLAFKRKKYLPILHEATCSNYFIVNSLMHNVPKWSDTLKILQHRSLTICFQSDHCDQVRLTILGHYALKS